jgi:hypothetical protein
MAELQARFGAAARDVLEAYRAADAAGIQRACERVRVRLGSAHAEWNQTEAELLAPQ